MSPERPTPNLNPGSFFLKKHLEDGTLHELVFPKPEDVGTIIVGITEQTPEGTVNIIWSSHMFSCKTTAAILAAKELKEKGREVFVFQPDNGARNEDKLQVNYKNRKLELNANLFTIKSNNIFGVLEIIQGKILDGSLKIEGKKPVIVIDELMLFSEHGSDPTDAIEVIEKLRTLGFDVIATGLTLDYKGEPFHFFKELVDTIPKRSDPETSDLKWYGHEMKTKCYYCGDWANVTQRIMIDSDTGNMKLCPYSGKTDQKGGPEAYRSICGDCGQESCDKTC